MRLLCSPDCLQVSHIIEPSGTPREYDPDDGPQTTVCIYFWLQNSDLRMPYGGARAQYRLKRFTC